VRVFTAFWLAAALSFSLFGAVELGASLAHGHGTGGYLPMLLVPTALVAFGVGMVGFYGVRGREDERFLRSWLRQTLQAP
jgi:hypothetical protein